jgi:hypothetical protein
MRRLLLLVLAVLGQLAISVPALAVQDENNWNFGAFYGINFALSRENCESKKRGTEWCSFVWVIHIPA